MRKYYLDNIRWVTVVLVVIYHVLYMYNGEGVLGGVGKITALDVQYYDIFLYAVYPWFMLLLFLVSGICSRYYLDSHTAKEFTKSRTRKLLMLPKQDSLKRERPLSAAIGTVPMDTANMKGSVLSSGLMQTFLRISHPGL